MTPIMADTLGLAVVLALVPAAGAALGALRRWRIRRQVYCPRYTLWTRLRLERNTVRKNVKFTRLGTKQAFGGNRRLVGR